MVIVSAHLLLLAPLAAAAPQGSWVATELAKVVASDGGAGDELGTSASLSGDTCVLGAPFNSHTGFVEAGAAYVFERDQGGPNAWGEVLKLTASDATDGDEFGIAASIHGDTLVVGAHLDDHAGGVDAGAAYVFVRTGGSPAWGQVAKLTASDAADGDGFGGEVAIEGDRVVIGARRDDHGGGTDAGAAYVFERDQGGLGAWGQVKKLTAGDAADGDEFGSSVSLSGGTVVVGSVFDDTTFFRTGSAYVFERDEGGNGAWGEQAKLVASDASSQDLFGEALAVDGDTAVVGCFLDDYSGFFNVGSAYVYDRGPGGAWTEVAKLLSPDGRDGDYFGLAVALEGGLAVIGAELHDQGGLPNSGAAYVFARSGGGPGVWGLAAKLASSAPAFVDHFGSAVSIQGETILVGMNLNPASTQAGAGLLFDFAPGPPVAYCTAGTSASGCVATLTSSGTPSASAASGFVLIAPTVEGNKDGIFFWGTGGRQAVPWGNGTSFRCVVPPVKRAGLILGVGTNGACDGYLSKDLNAHWCPTCPKQAHNPGVGALVQAQLWYRDPFSTDNKTTSFSDALEFTVAQ